MPAGGTRHHHGRSAHWFAQPGALPHFAARDRSLAESLQCRWLLMLAEFEAFLKRAWSATNKRRDLALVEAGDCLRPMAGSTGLLARISELRFALSLFETPPSSGMRAGADRCRRPPGSASQ